MGLLFFKEFTENEMCLKLNQQSSVRSYCSVTLWGRLIHWPLFKKSTSLVKAESNQVGTSVWKVEVMWWQPSVCWITPTVSVFTVTAETTDQSWIHSWRSKETECLSISTFTFTLVLLKDGSGRAECIICWLMTAWSEHLQTTTKGQSCREEKGAGTIQKTHI